MNSAMPTKLADLGYDPRVCSSEQFLKLPKWTQEYIRNLEREKANAERTLREFTDNQTPSDYYFSEFGKDGMKHRYLQCYSVSVKMTERHAINIHKRSDGTLDVSAEWGGLLIHPSASNSIKLTVKD